jgi:hypothetical protein
VLNQTLEGSKKKAQNPGKKDKHHLDLTGSLIEDTNKVFESIHHEEEPDKYDTTSQNSGNHRHIKMKQSHKLIYVMSLKIQGQHTEI